MLEVPDYIEESVHAGHSACPGCGSTLALRMVLGALDRKGVVFVPASCGSLYFGIEHTSTTFPAIHTVYGSGFCQAAGFSMAKRMHGDEDILSIVWGGDGAYFDIGMDGLSHVASQNFDMIAICNDNQGYQNTGGHSSSGTPMGTITKITPQGYNRNEKDLLEIVAAHRVPYAATISAAFPNDLRAKVRKASQIEGFKLLHLVSSCVNWKHDPDAGVAIARQTVNVGAHPLYEVFDGEEYIINHAPDSRVAAVDYLVTQRRFDAMDPTVFQAHCDAKWSRLMARAAGRVQPAAETLHSQQRV